MDVGRWHNCSNIYRKWYSIILQNLKKVQFNKQNFEFSNIQLLLSILYHKEQVNFCHTAIKFLDQKKNLHTGAGCRPIVSTDQLLTTLLISQTPSPYPTRNYCHHSTLCVDVFPSENQDYVHQKHQWNLLYSWRIVQNIAILRQLFKYRNVRSRERLHLKRAYIVPRMYWDGTPIMRILYSGYERCRRNTLEV